MSYELKKPISDKQKDDFIVGYNHGLGLRIEDTERYLFALESNEIMGTKDIEIDVPDEVDEGEEQTYHKEIITIPYPMINHDYEQEQAQKERERINNLSLTKREVFLALYKDKGITPEQIKAGINNPEALIEFEYANDYFRGNPLIDIIGQSLGYSSDDLDYLFEHKEVKNANLVQWQ